MVFYTYVHNAAERIFTAMILPKLDYCDFVWNNLVPSRCHALERLIVALATSICYDN